MPRRNKQNGSVFLITVFAIALLATITMGILQMTTEEIQVMRNQMYATEALATTEAGLNDALARIRNTGSIAGFTEAFNGGTYTVIVEGAPPEPNVICDANSSHGFSATVKAELTVASSGPPYVIRIDHLRINE